MQWIFSSCTGITVIGIIILVVFIIIIIIIFITIVITIIIIIIIITIIVVIIIIEKVFSYIAIERNVKRRLYEGVTVPTALYEAETWEYGSNREEEIKCNGDDIRGVYVE